MNASLWVRFLAAVLCFAAWGALVLMGKAPAAEFVFALGQALVGLGVYHASTSGTSGGIAGIAMPLEPVEPAAFAAPAAAASTIAAAPVAISPVPAVAAAAATLQ